MLNSHISELMLKNIEKEIALILQQEKYAWFYLFIWGYHGYIEIWPIKVGDDSLCLKSDNDNKHGKFVVTAITVTVCWAKLYKLSKSISEIFTR